MNFLRSIKPRSKAEWLILILVMVLAIATTVLAVTRQILPARASIQESEHIFLQAVTEAPTETPPGVTTAAPTPAATTVSESAQMQEALDDLASLGALLKNFEERQLRPLQSEFEQRHEQFLELVSEESQETEAALVYWEPEALPEETVQADETRWIPENWAGYQTQGNLPYMPHQQQIVSTMPQGGTLAQNAWPQQANPLPWNAPAPANPPPGGNPAPPPGGGGNPAPALPAEGPNGSQIIEIQNSVLNSINSARQAAGLVPLVWDATLQSIASQRAVDLSLYYNSGHARPDGSFSLTWISNSFGGNYAVGENIGWFDAINNCTAYRIFNEFFESPSHYAIMMNGGSTRGAIGVYCVPGEVPENGTGRPNTTGSGRFYVSMNFGN